MNLDGQLHETNIYHDPDFPVGMYTVTPEGIHPPGRGYHDLHWHEEMQITVCRQGKVLMQVNGTDYLLREGQGLFINRNCLHISKEMSPDGIYVSFSFPQKILSFFPGSRMEQKNVFPLTSDPSLQAVMLADAPWHREILALLSEFPALLGGERKDNFEYMISVRLVTIWLILITNAGRTPAKKMRNFTQQQERFQQMIGFIHENYDKHLKLPQIAESANISEGECCRCFRNMARMSPVQYLIHYRISRATDLLGETSLSVTEIAHRTGFADTSHFIQSFRRNIGVTPKEYRERKDTSFMDSFQSG